MITNIAILIMTIQFNGAHVAPKDSVFDVYHSAYKTLDTCWDEARKLEKQYKDPTNAKDVLFTCYSPREKL